MSSAGHCGRHERYRCSECEKNYPDDYHGGDEKIITHQDIIDGLQERIAELEADRRVWRESAETLGREVAALREQVARMPVVTGYVSEDRITHLRNMYKRRGEEKLIVCAVKDGYFTHPIYIDPPEEKGNE